MKVQQISYSEFITFLIIVLLGFIGCEGSKVEQHSIKQPNKKSNKVHKYVRDRLHIWTHPAGSHDGYYLAPNTFVKSKTTPLEGANFLGISNIYFIQYGEKPLLSEYSKYAQDFKPLDNVVWSLTGLAGKTSPEIRNKVFEIAKEYPNVSGFILDDFFKWGEVRNHEKLPQWLAKNEADFPVTLTLVPPAPVYLDNIHMAQTIWPTGDYRTNEFEVEFIRNNKVIQLVKGKLDNIPGNIAQMESDGHTIDKVNIRILNSYDINKAKSCGLSEVQLLSKGKQISAHDWEVSASSTYSSKHKPENIFYSEFPSTVKENSNEKSQLKPVAASLTPDELKSVRKEAFINGKQLPIVCGIYENQISDRIMPHIEHVDKVVLWTWVADDLKDLKKNFEKLEKLVSPKPVLLGCYMYDYGGTRPISVEEMEFQCDLGLKWLKEKRIEGIVFLASNICDQNLEAVDWTKNWISKVGGHPVN